MCSCKPLLPAKRAVCVLVLVLVHVAKAIGVVPPKCFVARSLSIPLRKETPACRILFVSVDIRSNRDSFDGAASVVSDEPELQVEILDWDNETFTLGPRNYRALRNEADETIVQSRIVWPDSPSSWHAVQSECF
jgi:hypothetical protein